MKTSRLLIAAALLCMFVSATQAQDRLPKDPAKAEAVKELRAKIVSFFQNNVQPEMLKWKTQLDAALAPQDLLALNKLRKEAKGMKTDEMTATRQMKKAWRDENYDALKRSRDVKKNIAEDRKELLADLKPIAVKYKSTLVAIGEVAKPQAAKWRAQGKEFIQAWVEKYKDTFGEDGMKHALALLHQKFAGIPGLDKETKAKVAAAKFMLWDGSDFTQTFEGGMQGRIDSAE